MPRDRAFTLVELLVTVGLIGLLVALLLPVLAGARDSARMVACRSNLQQIGQGMRGYLNHSNDIYPWSPSIPSVNPDGRPDLSEALSPYVGDTLDIYKCPADDFFFELQETSYYYYGGVAGRRLDDTLRYRVLGHESAVPILWDADAFHGGNVPFNWLFADGHVEKFLEQPN